MNRPEKVPDGESRMRQKLDSESQKADAEKENCKKNRSGANPGRAFGELPQSGNFVVARASDFAG